MSRLPLSLYPDNQCYLGVRYASWQQHALAKHGVYWASCEQAQDGQALLLQLLSQLPEHAQAVVIGGQTGSLELTQSLLPTQGPQTLTCFDATQKQLTELLNSFNAFRVRYRWQEADLVIIWLPSVWLDKTFISLVKKISSNLKMRVLMLSVGQVPPHAYSAFLEQDALKGYVEFYRQNLALMMQLHHWRNEQGASNNVLCQLVQTPAGYWAAAEDETTPSVSDQRHCYLEQSVMFGAPVLNPLWHVCADQAAVFAMAERSQAATVVLAIKRNADVSELAQRILALRQLAPRLKVLVRELEPCLRYRDERLLTACGMTLRISYDIASATFLSLVEAMRCLAEQHYSSTDFLSLEHALKAPHQRGVLDLAEFKQVVSAALSNTQGLISHQLVRFDVQQGLSAARCLKHIALRRYGDVGCFVGEHFYLFLFGCRADVLLAALNNIFDLPWTILFSRYVVLHSVDEVMASEAVLLANFNANSAELVVAKQAAIGPVRTTLALKVGP